MVDDAPARRVASVRQRPPDAALQPDARAARRAGEPQPHALARRERAAGPSSRSRPPPRTHTGWIPEARMRRSEPGRAGGGHDPQPAVAAGERERAAVGRPRRARVARPGADDADELRGRRRVDRDLAREAVDRRPRRRHQACRRARRRDPTARARGRRPPGARRGSRCWSPAGRSAARTARRRRPRRAAGGRRASWSRAVERATVSRPLPSARARNRYGVWRAGRDPARERRQRLGDRLDRRELPAVGADLRRRARRRRCAAAGPRAAGPCRRARRPRLPNGDAEARAVARRRQPRVDRAAGSAPSCVSWAWPEPSGATRQRFGKQR